ncbi:Uncharacterized protein HZ326_29846 [Fusarium oxysporum f. sp. albedinis]|nr:Uncharacterized protein HZ326_29846 [Fusarium oxysporum f. sp. albedinis]
MNPTGMPTPPFLGPNAHTLYGRSFMQVTQDALWLLFALQDNQDLAKEPGTLSISWGALVTPSLSPGPRPTVPCQADLPWIVSVKKLPAEIPCFLHVQTATGLQSPLKKKKKAIALKVRFAEIS